MNHYINKDLRICIAINSGTSHVNITGVMCGPGHGISLGQHGSYSMVEDVQVRNCTFKVDTTNGARIKTWKGGSGYAKHIIFENIVLQEIKNPIIIDQAYFDKGFGTMSSGQAGSAVQVSDVVFRKFRGSVEGDVAVTLDCNNRVACENIVMDHIDLTPCEHGKKLGAYCKNVQGLHTSLSPSVPCA